MTTIRGAAQTAFKTERFEGDESLLLLSIDSASLGFSVSAFISRLVDLRVLVPSIGT
jgi:hypothetical protein